MIVPKVGGARARAQRLSCASNMRGIVRGLQLYEEDYSYDAFHDPSNGNLEANTAIIFGKCYYLENDPQTGDKMTGLTSLKIYTCPASDSVPPTPGAQGYGDTLGVTPPSMIDYAVVTRGNFPSFKNDPDKNAILIEIEPTHQGRNVAFWDSTVQFFQSGTAAANWPNNVDYQTGQIDNTSEIYEAGAYLQHDGAGGGLTNP
jgi:hypothetical protein